MYTLPATKLSCFLNGKSLGKKSKGQYEYRLRWDSVRYEPGTLLAVAYRNGKEWARDTRETTGAVSGLTLIPEESMIQANGTDLCFVRVVGVDRNGHQVPTAQNLIRFTLNGPGMLAAVANGDATCMDSFRSDRYPLFNGQCLAIVRSSEGKGGTIQLSAASVGLESGTITVRSH